jgi:DNA-binding NtrC family response regulator
LLYSLQKSLRSKSLEVLTASTGKQGIQLAREQRPEAVLVDLWLPDIAGLEVIDRIRQNDARPAIVIMTAYATPQTAIEATKRGALEYLTKPIDLHRLRKVVDQAIELGRRQRLAENVDGGKIGPDAPNDGGMGDGPAMPHRAIGPVAPVPVISSSEPLHLVKMIESLIHAGDQDIYRKVCLEVERLVVTAVLKHAKGSQAQASQLLGISRTTLRGKLRALRMAVTKKLLTEPKDCE